MTEAAQKKTTPAAKKTEPRPVRYIVKAGRSILCGGGTLGPGKDVTKYLEAEVAERLLAAGYLERA